MKRLIQTLGLVFLSTLIVACTGSEKPAKSGKKIYKFNLGAEPATLHPISSSGGYASKIQSYIQDALVIRDPESYELVPALAEKFEINKEGTVFTYHLRKGVKWHDGKPFTSADVKATFDAYFDDNYDTLSARPYLNLINSPEIIDEHTIKFTVKEKYFGNFNYLNGIVLPVPKHIYADSEKGKKINFELVGTGPFKLKKFQRGKKIILEKNPDWWGWKVDYFKKMYGFDEIHALFIKEEAIAMEHFKKGKIHHLAMSPEDYVKRAVGPKWGKELKKIKTQNLAPKSHGTVIFNMRKPLFQDKKLRKALTHLMNRELINQKFRFNMSVLSTGPWYPQSDYASKRLKPLSYDPKKAGALLKEAGWADNDSNGILEKTINGKKTELKFTLHNSNKDNMKYFTLYKEDAAKAGVHIDLNLVEWNTLVKLFDELNFDTVALGWGGGAIDLDPKQLWHCESGKKGGSNLAGYCNKEVDALIEKGRLTLDRDERIKIFRTVYEMIAEDQPNLWLFAPNFSLYGAHENLIREKDTYKYAIGSEFWSMKSE